MSEPSLRTPLGRVRGLGSAKDGTNHWWMQRLTALALVPLCLWLVASLAGLAGAGHEAVLAWLAAPLNAIAMALLIAALFWHAALGLRVVVEDYVHHEGRKLAWLVAIQFTCVVLAAMSLFAILKIAVGG